LVAQANCHSSNTVCTERVMELSDLKTKLIRKNIILAILKTAKSFYSRNLW